MKFTSLKGFLKPGTEFHGRDREWVVEYVEYDGDDNPLFWSGRTRHVRDKCWVGVIFYLDYSSDDAYDNLTITKLGGTPLKLEDLI